MGLTLAESLSALALSQGAIVAPPLGESYAGKSAGTIAALLAMLAADAATRPERTAAMAARLERLLAAAGIGPPPADAPDRWDRLWAAFTGLHAWADDSDPELARTCRLLLRDWTAGERLVPPLPPADA
jgi:hypothetical protein